MRLFSSKEIAFYSFYAICSSLVFETPIIVVFFLKRGLTYAQIAVLFSIFSISVFLFEYITGVIADRTSRKGSLIASAAMLVIAEGAFISGRSMTVFVIAIVIIACSVATASGANSAFIYDKLKACGPSDAYKGYVSRLNSLLLIVAAIAGVAGSQLTKISIETPFVATMIVHVAAIMLLLLMTEPQRDIVEGSSARVIRKSLRFMISTPSVARAVMLSILVFSSAHLLQWIYQPYLLDLKYDVDIFGIFYTLLILSQAFGSRTTAWLHERLGMRSVLSVATIGVFLGFAVMIAGGRWAAFLAPLVLGVSFGLFYTGNDIFMNDAVTSDIRASTLSLQHALSKILQVVIYLSLGVGMGVLPVKQNIAIFTLFFLLSTAALLLRFRPAAGKIAMAVEK